MAAMTYPAAQISEIDAQEMGKAWQHRHLFSGVRGPLPAALDRDLPFCAAIG
jgi:hypothetical protein